MQPTLYRRASAAAMVRGFALQAPLHQRYQLGSLFCIPEHKAVRRRLPAGQSFAYLLHEAGQAAVAET